MLIRKVVSCLCALALAVLQVPAFAFADDAAPSANGAVIAELLSAGNYVEGEAIAIVRAGAEPDVRAQAEELAEIGADSLELAVEGARETSATIDDEAALRAQSAKDDSYTIRHVVDHSRTTEQILYELYDDPNVISAEPNYLVEGPAALDGEGESPAGEGEGDAAGQPSSGLLAAGA